MKKAGGAINPDCSGTACCWSDSRGAAAEESPPDRVSIEAIQLVSPPVPRQFGWLCASLAT